MLELDRLSRRFGDVRALDGLTFSVARGELCGFLGPNGAGKTTAMRAVLGVTRLDAGVVRWDGQAVDADLRRRTGYLPEERGLYPKMRVGEHLIYLGRLHGLRGVEAERRTLRLLDELGLADRAATEIESLSLGNQQRVQLAAALVHDPELLVLDEPFSGLDPIAVDTMSAMLRDRARDGAAVVFSSHQLDLVEDLCSTVAVVAAGRTVLSGEVEAIRAAGERRLHVASSGPVRWEQLASPDAALASSTPTSATFVLTRDADPLPILAGVRQVADLTGVSLSQPRLSELFRDAVGPGGVQPPVAGP
ncbi:MAG: ATP-binding cassette domain-containing protein [Nitriliruptor sp.]